MATDYYSSPGAWFGSNMPRAPKVPPTITQGFAGVAVIGGRVQAQERNHKLVAPERYQTYRNEIVNTPVAALAVRLFLDLVASAEWTFTAPKDSAPEAEDIATWVTAMVHDMESPWSQVVRYQASCGLFDFAIQEWTAKRCADGRLGLLDIEPRPNHTIWGWDIDEHGGLRGVWQRNVITSEVRYLPRSKIAYTVDQTLTDSPEGMGRVRHLIAIVARLARYLELEGYGFEGGLRGVPKARIPYQELARRLAKHKTNPDDPEAMSAADVAAAIAPLEKIVQSHINNPELGITMDSATWRDIDPNKGTPSSVYQWDLEVIRAELGTGQQDIDRAIDRCKREILAVLNADGVMLGDKSGSYALDKSKMGRLVLVVNGALKEVGRVMKRDVIRQICLVNGIDEALVPDCVPAEIGDVDVAVLAGALVDLVNSGLPKRDPMNDWFRSKIGAPPAPEDEEPALAPAGPDPGIEAMRRARGGAGVDVVPPGAEPSGARKPPTTDSAAAVGSAT